MILGDSLIRVGTDSGLESLLPHSCKTPDEKRFSEELAEILNKGFKEFWYSDLTLTRVENSVCFRLGAEPLVGFPYQWWRENSEKISCSTLGLKGELAGEPEFKLLKAMKLKRDIGSGEVGEEEGWDLLCNVPCSDNDLYQILQNRFVAFGETLLVPDHHNFWLAGGPGKLQMNLSFCQNSEHLSLSKASGVIIFR